MGTPSSNSTAPRWSSVRSIDIDLHSAWKKALLLLAVLAISAFLGERAYRTIKIYFLAESDDANSLRSAIAMDPSDPEPHHRLGMILFGSPSEPERMEGLQQLHLATDLNPYNWHYWTDLAWGCEMAGEAVCALHGIKEAVRHNPVTPQVRWLAGNTYLREGETDEALVEFRRLLELDPSYAPATFHLCLGSLGNPQMILEKVVPQSKNPALKLVYLNILSHSEMDGADALASEVWKKTVDEGTPFPLPAAADYIEHLIHYGRIDEAQKAWGNLESMGVVPKRDENGNLVCNGDFGHTPLNTAFDWRSGDVQYLFLDYADTGGESGKTCLRIEFTVSRNEAYQPLFQVVPVRPNTEYILSASVRSADITSDSGPRFQVLDPIHSTNGPSVMTDSTVGTTPWHPTSVHFCSGPNTSAVQLSLLRLRGRTYPTEITGSFWVGNVAIKAAGPASPSGCKSLQTLN
jgi:tetratricopeptide (TPR) repeat protein